MWIMARRGWLRRAYRILRASRVSGYAILALSGLVSLFIPPASVSEASQQTQVVLSAWSLLMVVAGGLCAYGAATDRWIGEYIGLIPLGMVALAYAVSALARGSVGWAGGLFLVGFFLALFSRWQEVALLRAEAIQANHGGATDDDHA